MRAAFSSQSTVSTRNHPSTSPVVAEVLPRYLLVLSNAIRSHTSRSQVLPAYPGARFGCVLLHILPGHSLTRCLLVLERVTGRAEIRYPDSDGAPPTLSPAPSSAVQDSQTRPHITPSLDTIPNSVSRIIEHCPAAIKYLTEYASGTKITTTSHSAKRGPGHLPRPPNAFMLYRSFFCAVGEHGEDKHNLLSKRAGEKWRELSSDKREPFVQAAELVRKRHADMYPDYKYIPASATKRPLYDAHGSSETRSAHRRHSVTTAASPVTACQPAPSPSPATVSVTPGAHLAGGNDSPHSSLDGDIAVKVEQSPFDLQLQPMELEPELPPNHSALFEPPVSPPSFVPLELISPLHLPEPLPTIVRTLFSDAHTRDAHTTLGHLQAGGAQLR